MTYLSEVLADTPTVYYPLDVYSSGFTDSSGNTRPLDVISGTAPSATSGSPGGGTSDSAEWGTSTGHIRTTYTRTGQPTLGTYEFWIYYPGSAPAADLTIMSWAPNSGTNGTTSMVQLLTTGKIRFRRFAGAFVNMDDPNALSTGWHHVVVVWGTGAGTNRIRIDKTTVVSTATGGSTNPGGSPSFRLHGDYSGTANVDQTGALKIAHAAFYAGQLSDARIDAHYDAMTAPVLVSGDAAVAAVTALSGSALTAISVTGDRAVVGVTALDGTASSGPIVVSGVAAAVAATALDGSAQTQILVGGDVAALNAHANDGSLLVGPVPGAVAVVNVTALEGGVLTQSGTDTSNTFEGRSRDGLGIVTLEVPVTTPIATAPTKVDKAIPLPLPVLVKGRPT